MEKYFVTFSASGKLDLFYFDIDLNEYKMFYSIPFKKKLQDAVCLTVLNDSYLLLLTGGYDSVIHVYTVMRIKEINTHLLNKTEFTPVMHKLSMQGHVNNIRDISAICPLLDDTEHTYFASASQDTYIRLWHVVELQSSELKSMADTINQKGSLSIFDEYKSKTSYVIKTEKDEYYNIILDSVISGHEESVSSIRWGYLNNKPVLLSSSFDFTVGIWSFDETHVIILILII
jgi:WD40 repeat protein